MLPDIKQCKMCNKPFQTYAGNVCSNCLDKIDEDFVKIRDYLYDNPGHISIEELSEKTDVSENIIIYLLKEKRLSITNLKGGALICEVCHREIKSGTLCSSCKESLAIKLQSSLPKTPPATDKKQKETGGQSGRKTSKMHIEHGK